MVSEIQFVSFTLQREEFILLLLLSGTVNLATQKSERISLNGCTNHKKYGTPGIEDGTNHFFDTIVGHDGHFKKIFGVCVHSHDDGKTYEGLLSFEIYRDDIGE